MTKETLQKLYKEFKEESSKTKRKEFRKNLNKLSPANENKLNKRFWKKVEQDKFDSYKPSSKPTTTKLAEVYYEVLEAEEIKNYGFRTNKCNYSVGKFLDMKLHSVIKWFDNEEEAYCFLDSLQNK